MSKQSETEYRCKRVLVRHELHSTSFMKQKVFLWAKCQLFNFKKLCENIRAILLHFKWFINIKKNTKQT